ncbi:Probable WRKY transcription factor 15 [Striga hermonthica]|uniref:Probable WRKY transcription factor 15 n=1 Tax=Striga hermonthica TaxID=68872 RepID=A0A9N7MGH4_STRHE|nr:Probable WRKY transcription factor 15 [Striga hermonthica]
MKKNYEMEGEVENEEERDISLLGQNLTGHAQFRWAPATSSRRWTTTADSRGLRRSTYRTHPPIFRANLFASSLTHGDTAGKPLLSSSSPFKRKCDCENAGASGKCSGSSSSHCHCSKRKIK